MSFSKNHRAKPSLGDDFEVSANTAALALTELQKDAAKQRAAAEALLDQARVFEEQLASESVVLAGLAASADAAAAAEREAAAVVQRLREELAPLTAARAVGEERYAKPQRAVDAAQAECAAAEERLEGARQTLAAALANLPADAPSVQRANAAEETARAELDKALQLFDDRKNTRSLAEQELHRMQAQIARTSAIDGPATLAARRIAERRIADALRHGEQNQT